MGQPLNDIEAFLLGIPGLVETGWLLYKARVPDTPDQVIVINETPFLGPAPDTYGPNNAQMQFQVRIRASALEYEIAREKWQECWTALHNASFTLGGRAYIYTMATNDAPIGWYDVKQRPNLTCEFRVMMRR